MDVTFSSTIKSGLPVKIECELDGGVWHVTGIYWPKGGNIPDRLYCDVIGDRAEIDRINSEAWQHYRGYYE